MRIAASLSVKDEAELIEPAIAHLRNIGVDLIIACDVSSTDGTYEILEKYRSDSDFWLYRLSDSEGDSFEPWRRTMLALVKSAEVDWVIFLDADEFWLPASGNLKGCAGLADADVLSVDRYNVPVSSDGALFLDALAPKRYEDIILIVEESADLKTELEANPSLPWIARATTDSKLMARPESIGALALGGHLAVSATGEALDTVTPSDLIIAHLPFTTIGRFNRKVENIRKILGAHQHIDTGRSAWHWKRWLKLAEEGTLEAEFERSVWQPEKIAELRQQGSIRSAAEILQKRKAKPKGKKSPRAAIMKEGV